MDTLLLCSISTANQMTATHCFYACRHGEDQNRKDLMSSRPVATPVSEDLETEAAAWTCSPESDITGLEICFLV